MVKKKKKEPPDILGANFIKEQNLYRTIKTSFKSIIKDPEIHDKINELITKCNHIVIDTYMFIRLYALYKYNNNLDIPDLDEDFISYCIMTLGERDNRGKQPKNTDLIDELKEFYINEFQPIYNHTKFDLKCLSFTLPYICQTMQSCISTNLKEHFVKRLFRFINTFCNKYYDSNYSKIIQDDKKKDYIVDINLIVDQYDIKFLKLKQAEYNKTKKETIWKLKKAIIENKLNEIPEQLLKWFNIHHHSFIPDEVNKSIPYDCKCDPYKYIKYSFYMNEKYEEYNETIREQIQELQNNNGSTKEIKLLNCEIIKLFQPLSLRKSCVPKYVTIDTATLINLFSERGNKGKLLQSLKENQELVWYDYFRMDRKIFKSSKDYIFNYTIQTDGIGCSILFKHISLKNKKYGGRVKEVSNDIPYIDDLNKTQLEILQNKKIICLDPGKKNLAYMMDDEGNELKYTCMQRDTESLAKRNKRILITNKKRTELTSIINPETSNIIEQETILSKYLSTTVNYDKFKDFIKMKHKVNQNTKSFYEKELYRKLNWRKKTYRQRSEDKFLNNIETKFGSKDDFVICLGDWSNKSSAIKGASTMCLGLKKLISKRYTNTMLIDEYNTSKKCCNCWNDIENVEINGNKKFRLLGCKNCRSEAPVALRKVNSSLSQSGKGCNIDSPEDEHKLIFQTYSFLTRDKNSCINMLSIAKHMIYKNKTRPQQFCRGD